MNDYVRLPREPTQNQIEAAVHILSPDINPARARRALKQIYEAFIDMRPDVEHPRGLTKKMAQLLEVILEYQEEHGYSPTHDELAAAFGVDRTTIRRRLHAMRRRGYIQMRRGYRGIVVIQHT